MAVIGLSSVFMNAGSFVLQPLAQALFAVPLGGTMSLTLLAASL